MKILPEINVNKEWNHYIQKINVSSLVLLLQKSHLICTMHIKIYTYLHTIHIELILFLLEFDLAWVFRNQMKQFDRTNFIDSSILILKFSSCLIIFMCTQPFDQQQWRISSFKYYFIDRIELEINNSVCVLISTFSEFFWCNKKKEDSLWLPDSKYLFCALLFLQLQHCFSQVNFRLIWSYFSKKLDWKYKSF